ncbi:MAG: hypothetical protein EXS18_05490 [Verrucomicrobiae bacterium]|nr:hypothetical protein [Verrucomicrobiae bacterium]
MKSFPPLRARLAQDPPNWSDHNIRIDPLAAAYAEWIHRNDAGQDMTWWLINAIIHSDGRGHWILADGCGVLSKSR